MGYGDISITPSDTTKTSYKPIVAGKVRADLVTDSKPIAPIDTVKVQDYKGKAPKGSPLDQDSKSYSLCSVFINKKREIVGLDQERSGKFGEPKEFYSYVYNPKTGETTKVTQYIPNKNKNSKFSVKYAFDEKINKVTIYDDYFQLPWTFK